jgi:transposase
VSDPQLTPTSPDTELTPPPAQIEDDRAYRRLTDEHKATILRLDAEGLTQTVIAQHLGVNVSTVCRTLQAYKSTVDLAKRRFEAAANTIASELVSWAQTRDKIGLDAAKTVLLGAGVTEKRQDHGVSLQVNVGVALPGTPQYTALVQQEAKVNVTAAHNPAIDV